mmetsp:Transcript_40910/g.127654  ORF Transcript_40910/g.127654 Transcript_40910/m.127654 type:complete len:284 (-) Transcript_40910:80-931(-)
MQDSGLSLTRPKLDATLVIGSSPEDDDQEHEEQQPPQLSLFALASLNTKTAASMEVRWSQLLALSLLPEDDPVLTVGRHKDCGLHLEDPRASLLHFEIKARRQETEEGVPPSSPQDASTTLAYECFLHDCSSNGTAVNGSIVGKGNSKQIRSGDEICVLPASRVGPEEMIAFIFRNTTESFAESRKAPVLELDELVLCPICMQVMKNHPMDAVVEAFLEASPQWKRADEELRAMDARDQLRLGSSGKLVRNCHAVDAAVSPMDPANFAGREVVRRNSKVCAVQ